MENNSSISSSLQQWLSSNLLLLISSITISVYLIRYLRGNGSTSTDKPAPPKLPRAWPVLGHLHLLGGNQPFHIILGAMADKYGPAFNMSLGTYPALVVSSSEIAKECFTSTNDKSFSHRQVPAGVKHMFYNHDSFGFAPYGSFWREMRKMITLSLFSTHRVEMLNQIRASQLNIWFEKLYQMCSKEKNSDGVLVDMKSWLDEMFFHVLVNMIVKPTVEDEELVKKYREVAMKAGHLLSAFAVSDFVPFLGWLDYVFGTVGKMKKTGKDMDSILSTWLEQHKTSQQLKTSNASAAAADQTEEEEEEEKEFIVELLSMQESALFGHERDIVIKSACQALIMAGSDTTSATITWVLSLLMKHPDVFEKAREELDQVVGKNRQVDDSDIKNLVYLQAILKETMRLYPAATLLARVAEEDCIVGGFHVPAGTQLFVNVSKVQRDPNVWTDPLEFKPERFLTGNAGVDLKGQDFELIPFGSGRRMCPAVTFAVRVMHLILGRLIHSFEVKTREVDLDMSESSGHTNCRFSPLEVLISPRLDSKIYS